MEKNQLMVDLKKRNLMSIRKRDDSQESVIHFLIIFKETKYSPLFFFFFFLNKN